MGVGLRVVMRVMIVVVVVIMMMVVRMGMEVLVARGWL